MSGVGTYLYAVSRASVTDRVPDLQGLRNHPLRALTHEGLAAVVSTVDLEEFGEDGLSQHLEDIRWLEEVARVHDDVVRAVAALGAVAPLRLATIFLDDEAVRQRLVDQRDALAATLDRVDGRAEWSVKALVAEPSAPVAPSATGPGSGAAYLQRRRQQTQQRGDMAEQAATLGQAVHEELAEQAVASRRLRPQDRRLTGHTGLMVLNGAYLVDTAAVQRFQQVVRRLAAEHPAATIDVQGPWPPYSFATLDEP